MEMANKLAVQRAKLQDEKFLKTGVEEEDIEYALMYFKDRDPEVMQALMVFAAKVQSRLGNPST